MYVFVRKDLPFSQQVVQVSHACIEATRYFLDSDTEHPHLIVLGVNNESKLYQAIQKLNFHGIRHKPFREADRNDEITAVATEIVTGERRSIFKKYQLLSTER